jgi:ribosomal protein S18 acetylase RimI-like enzyme
MSNIQFKKITLEQIPAMQEDARLIWTACYSQILDSAQINYMLNWMYSCETIKREIEDEGINYFFIFNDEIKIGFCSLGSYPAVAGQAKLHKLYLYPEFHGKGLGSKSLQEACNFAINQGYESIRLNVNKNNSAAIKAYERNGFKKTESVVNDIGGGYVMDDYVMLKSLKNSGT